MPQRGLKEAIVESTRPIKNPKIYANEIIMPIEQDSGTGQLSSAAKEKHTVTTGMRVAPVSIIIPLATATLPDGNPQNDIDKVNTDAQHKKMRAFLQHQYLSSRVPIKNELMIPATENMRQIMLISAY